MDYNKPETIIDALNGIDRLFLLTLPTPNMSEISSSIIKEAKKSDIKRIVKVSVTGADDKPGTILGRLHRQEEKIIEESGIPYTFLRCRGFMQNFVTYYGQTIRTQNAFYLPAGDGKVSFVDVRDIAAVAAEILLYKNNGTGSKLEYTNKAYDITGPEAISYTKAAEILSNILERKISYVNISEHDYRMALRKIGLEDWDIEALIDLYNIIESGFAAQTTAIIKQITGRKPISFEQFAREHISFFN
jgi:uncharacterized protein YbjT (DUF2867 family)